MYAGRLFCRGRILKSEIAKPGALPNSEALGKIVFASAMPIVITDPHLEDNPIVFVNQAFERLTGYNADEAIGRNCRFLQGPLTSQDAIHAIRDGLEAKTSVAVRLLNYRRNGTAFWNDLHIAPVIEGGQPRYFFGTQLDVTNRVVLNDPVLAAELSTFLKTGGDALNDERVQELISKADATQLPVRPEG